MSPSNSPASTSQASPRSVRDVCDAMESIAPAGLAQAWDNVGLLVGDPASVVNKVMLCIDLTGEVAKEAIAKKVDLVLAYHPPLFKPINTIRADRHGTEAIIHACIRHNIAIYSTHTALDAASGGTNDVLAEICGVPIPVPLEYMDDPSGLNFKLIVYVPTADVEKVAAAVYQSGGGHIGNYSHCSFRSKGQGTFLGSDTTNPAIGKPGQLETVEEIRFETIVPSKALPAVVSAMILAHPYEEPAFDLFALKPTPVKGIGRIGKLKQSTTLQELALKLKTDLGAKGVQIVGSANSKIDHIVVVVGAAGSLPFKSKLTPSCAIITGEIRHHDALTIQRVGCCAIALGHWTSERPVLAPLSKRLGESLLSVEIVVSEKDQEPFQPI